MSIKVQYALPFQFLDRVEKYNEYGKATLLSERSQANSSLVFVNVGR